MAEFLPGMFKHYMLCNQTSPLAVTLICSLLAVTLTCNVPAGIDTLLISRELQLWQNISQAMPSSVLVLYVKVLAAFTMILQV